MKNQTERADLSAIRADFDEIARLGEQFDSGSARFDAFVHSLVPPKARRVLDVGCGTGRLTVRLLQPQRECVGVDISPEMIRRAGRHSSMSGLSFMCGDFLELEFDPAEFDCVVSSAAFHHMSADVAITRMKQLLRPGGRLIIHDLRRSSGVFDELLAWSGLAYDAGLRLLRTGWPLRPRAVRRAWAKHGSGETYPTIDDVHALAASHLPNATIFKHNFWRYTMVWDKGA